MQAKQSIEKIYSFIKYWEKETLTINKKFDNVVEYSNVITSYMRLLDTSIQQFRGVNDPKTRIQVLDCICITYENLSEVYKQNDEKLKEIEINIFAFQFIERNGFNTDIDHNTQVLRRYSRAYRNVIESIQGIDDRFSENIINSLSNKQNQIQQDYIQKRKKYEIN